MGAMASSLSGRVLSAVPDAGREAGDYLRQAILDAGSGPEWPREAYPFRLESVGVVGAGAVGSGIAISFLNAEIPVVLLDRDAATLKRGVERVREGLESARRKGRLMAHEIAARMELLHPATHCRELAQVDWAIEAVYENLTLKREVMGIVGRACKPSAVIASNTSSLDLDDLARASGRPQDVVGMHFLTPSHVQPLVEVVRGAASSDQALFVARQVAMHIRRIPVQSRVGLGFIGARMLSTMLREADFLLLEGASPERIDQAMEAFGFAMGPCRMMDLIGMDNLNRVTAERRRQMPPDAQHPAHQAMTLKLAALGRNGQKNGRGFYRYEGRTPLADPSVMELAETLAGHHDIARRRKISEAEIVRRCVLPLVNEGWQILREGIARRASDIDLIWAYGYGFPRDKGGPMYYAARLGADAVRRDMAAIAKKSGNDYGYWTPAG